MSITFYLFPEFSTHPITATPAADYEVYNGLVVEFGAGVRSINVPVGITNDRLTELNETFKVALYPADSFQLCDTINEATITILEVDNDRKYVRCAKFS